MFVLSVALLSLSGCITAARQAFYEIRGAKADVLLNDPGPASAVATYGTVTFEPLTTTLSAGLCPPRVLTEYDKAASSAQTVLSEVFTGGGPTLSVGGEVQYFQEKGFFSGAQCLTRVRMTDGGRTVIDALVLAESKSLRAGGEEDLARASVKAIAEFLAERKDPEKTRQIKERLREERKRENDARASD
jgi:hypothetical protein